MTDNGDIVSYTPGINEPMRYTGEALAAIVARVWSDGIVTLVVFDEDGIVHSRRHVNVFEHDAELPASGPYAVARRDKSDLPEPTEPPVLHDIVPDSLPTGTPDAVLECHGSGFTPDSIITFNGTDEATVYESPIKISTVLEPATTSVSGTYPVTVKNAAGESNTLNFTFFGTAQTPSLNSINPSSARESVGVVSFNATGSKFYVGSRIHFGGGFIETLFVNEGKLTGTIDTHTYGVGSYLVHVDNEGSLSIDKTFTITAA